MTVVQHMMRRISSLVPLRHIPLTRNTFGLRRQDFSDMQAASTLSSERRAVYEAHTVDQLKEILRAYGLKVSGRKNELIERLSSVTQNGAIAKPESVSVTDVNAFPTNDDNDLSDDENVISDDEDFLSDDESHALDDHLDYYTDGDWLGDDEIKPQKKKKKKKKNGKRANAFEKFADFVRKHQPVDIDDTERFKELYKRETNQKWKPKIYRQFGYKKLKQFVHENPFIERKKVNGRWRILIKEELETNTSDVSERPQSANSAIPSAAQNMALVVPSPAEPVASGRALARSTSRSRPSPRQNLPATISARDSTETTKRNPAPSTKEKTFIQLNGYDDQQPSFSELANLRQLNGEGGNGKKGNSDDIVIDDNSIVLDEEEFAKLRTALSLKSQRPRVYLSNRSSDFHESALLGYKTQFLDKDESINDKSDATPDAPDEKQFFEADTNVCKSIYLNTHDPFCIATVGVQGAGKSHTLATVLESCLLPAHPIVQLRQPMTALVLHYDLNVSSICGVAGLLSPSSRITHGPKLDREQTVVLVSPTFYRQRKEFYGDYVKVRPLLLKWSSLTADHIKRIMGIRPADSQLYVASFLNLIRSYQRQELLPSFRTFIDEVREVCTINGQQGPLEQRISLLESIVADAEGNTDIAGDAMDIEDALASGLKMIIADLTDPLLSKADCNGLFQVITEKFRTTNTAGGKILALDEAHKFMDGVASDGLSESIVDAARLMRHDGMRLVVSTQSPLALAPELLELVSVAIMHQFHSHDWWRYLQHKLPMPDSAFSTILNLTPGHAMVFASRSTLADNLLGLEIRPRLTADFGSSRTN